MRADLLCGNEAHIYSFVLCLGLAFRFHWMGRIFGWTSVHHLRIHNLRTKAPTTLIPSESHNSLLARSGAIGDTHSHRPFDICFSLRICDTGFLFFHLLANHRRRKGGNSNNATIMCFVISAMRRVNHNIAKHTFSSGCPTALYVSVCVKLDIKSSLK